MHCPKSRSQKVRRGASTETLLSNNQKQVVTEYTCADCGHTFGVPMRVGMSGRIN